MAVLFCVFVLFGPWLYCVNIKLILKCIVLFCVLCWCILSTIWDSKNVLGLIFPCDSVVL